MQGVAAVSVNWGAWAGSGMAEKAGIERMERLGFGALQPVAGLAALGRLLASLVSRADRTAPMLMASVILWDRSEALPVMTTHPVHPHQLPGGR